MSEIHSYGKVWGFGHREASELVNQRVYIEEKVDGSQFSAKRVGADVFFRSKSVQLIDGAIPDLFRPSVEHIRGVAERMVEGATYRFEAMKAAKHNTLQYGRVPLGHCVMFDVDFGREVYANRETLVDAANALCVEPVPLIASNVLLTSAEDLLDLLKRDSFLGGSLVEGIVVKPHVNVYSNDGKRICGKIVSEHFKETHRKEWVPDSPDGRKVELRIADAIGTPARFAKAVQRLRERDELTGTVKDIGALIREVAEDIESECRSMIEEMLYEEYRKEVKRLAVRQVPQWYKAELVKSAFGNTPLEPTE